MMNQGNIHDCNHLNLHLRLRPPSPSHELQQVEPELELEPVPQTATLHLFGSSLSLSLTSTDDRQHSDNTSQNVSPVGQHSDSSSRNLSPTTVAGQAAQSVGDSAGQHESNNNNNNNPRRRRKKPNSASIEPPYPWSTVHRAVIRSLEYLRSNRIVTIAGEVRCKQCDEKYTMEYDLVEKFNELSSFIARKRDTLHDRAPSSWITPILPNCKKCNQESCVEPVIPEEEVNFSNINWLFLLLGQFLGRLKLKHLKYFCAYTSNHRTGAKNRLVYLTYLALCKQLEPTNRLFHLR